MDKDRPVFRLGFDTLTIFQPLLGRRLRLSDGNARVLKVYGVITGLLDPGCLGLSRLSGDICVYYKRESCLK